jgi:hypothetical protein
MALERFERKYGGTDAVDFDNINVLRVEPVARPDRGETETIAAVLEAVIAASPFTKIA